MKTNETKQSGSTAEMLIMQQLAEFRAGQKEMREEMDRRFTQINTTLLEFKSTIKDVNEIKEWKKQVNDVWSTPQMKDAKDEVYEQKNRWSKTIGILIAVEVVIGILMAMVPVIFKK